MNFSKRLTILRESQGLNKRELAEKVGFSPSIISMYESGERNPSIENLEILADYFNVDMNYLLGKSDRSMRYIDPIKIDQFKRINIFGRVPAGIPVEAVQDVVDFEDISFKKGAFSIDKDYIGLKVSGDSMYPKYLDGDTIIVEINPQPDSGSDCVVYVNGYDATLKQVMYDNESITLTPLNPSYPPKTYKFGDEEIKILGRVVEVRRQI